MSIEGRERVCQLVSQSVLPWSHHQVVAEVVGSYEFTDAQCRRAFAAVEREWKSGSGRFEAYHVAHRVCSALVKSRSVLTQTES